MGYVYQHVRVDKNEPFYIGISLKNDKKYKRAKSKTNRNEIWNRITKKTEYKIEILIDNVEDENIIKQKEIELIKLHGKICDNTGILANLTDGGDGILNFKHSIETILKMKLSSKGRDLSPLAHEKCKEANTGRKLTPKQIESIILTHTGKINSPETILKMKKAKEHQKVKVARYTLNMELIEIYDSITDTEKQGFSRRCVSACCRGKTKTHKNYLFKYYNNDSNN